MTQTMPLDCSRARGEGELWFRVAAKGMLLPDGAPFEGAGVAPDAPLDLAPGPEGADPALGRARAMLLDLR